MKFESQRVTYESYMKKLQERQGVVEERIMGEEFRSPSVQLRVTPLGKVELLSTHDQLLGGPSGQSYLGCVFPADTAYAALITQEAAKVGRRLAKEGVIGRFALDFVVVRSKNKKWDPYAIEINLRKGGTTHPFLTLQFLTDGTYNPETGIFTAPNGHQKFFVASDHVESPRLSHSDPGRSFRHRGAAQPAFWSNPPDRRRVSHDERIGRAGKNRDDGGWQFTSGREGNVRPRRRRSESGNARRHQSLSGNVWGAQAASCCQPVLFGGLPKSSGEPSHRKFLNGFNARRRQAADDYRLAAWASQNSVASRPQEIRLPAIRGSGRAKKMRKKS